MKELFDQVHKRMRQKAEQSVEEMSMMLHAAETLSSKQVTLTELRQVGLEAMQYSYPNKTPQTVQFKQ